MKFGGWLKYRYLLSRLAVLELKREHEEAIDRLKRAKNQEIDAVANANDTSRFVKPVSIYLPVDLSLVCLIHTLIFCMVYYFIFIWFIKQFSMINFMEALVIVCCY